MTQVIEGTSGQHTSHSECHYQMLQATDGTNELHGRHSE